jgi:hypothetical protein
MVLDIGTDAVPLCQSDARDSQTVHEFCSRRLKAPTVELDC